MLRRLLRKYGIAKTTIAIIPVAVLVSNFLYVVMAMVLGWHFDAKAFFMASSIPAIAAPSLTYFILKILHQLDLVEETLRSERAQLLSIFSSINQIIYIADPVTHEILFTNAALKLLLDKDPTGGVCHRELYGLDAPCVYCNNQRILEKKDTPCIREFHHPIFGRDFMMIDRIIQWPDGRLVRLEIAIDITDKIQAENKKKALEANLYRVRKMESLGTLAGGIAHDFNNILAAIMGYTELALDKAGKGTDIEESLEKIFSAGLRARDLIKQVLLFARRADEEAKPIPVARAAREVLTLLRATLPATISIAHHLNDDLVVMAALTHLHQLLLNLCTNAVQAMEDKGGILSVSLEEVGIDAQFIESNRKLDLTPGRHIQLKVADTGCGIPPDVMESIFEPYFTTKATGEGSGIGLSIVHGIVKNYGGDIAVASRLGAGTVFTIYLPAWEKSNEPTPCPTEDIPSGSERILVIDDEPSIAEIECQMLEDLGYRVTALTDSIAALDLFHVDPEAFDLVITDMTMPNLTGDQLALKVQAVRSDIPVILCTGYSKKISHDAALPLGIASLLYKPVVKKDMAKTIREVLEKSQEIRSELK